MTPMLDFPVKARPMAALLCFALTTASLPVRAICPPVDSGHCVSRALPGGGVIDFPRLRWTPIARAERTPNGDGFDLRYLKGSRTRVTRHSAAAALGLPGSLVSGVFYQPPGAAPIVFARFAPGSNQLRIDVLRIEREPTGGVRVADAQFGPHHGDVFIATQDFIDLSERAAGHNGRNPLAGWSAPNDDVFHNICFQCPTAGGALDPYTSGVAVALGIAMRNVGAQIGILAVAREWIDVQESSSGGLLWSTVTVKVSGYVRPDWWIASPIGAQASGTSSLGICAVSETPCQPAHLVRAGIQLAPWSGPNLPTDQDRLYYSENSQSGFTVLGYSLITAALVGVGSYLWGGALLSPGEAGAVAAQESTTQSLVAGSAGSALEFGMESGAGYIGASDLLHPGSTTNVQSSYLGANVNAGTLASSIPKDVIFATIQQEGTKLQVQRDLKSGLAAVQNMYQGQCADSLSNKECGKKPLGTVPRLNAPSKK